MPRRSTSALVAVVLAGLLAVVAGPLGPSPAAAGVPAFRSRIAYVAADELWASWRPGCPVGPDQLRRVTASHWGFDGAVHTGTLVVHADLAGEVAAILGDLYDLGFPIARMVPVEAYGGSDDASMEANNTSAFNCRAVTGGTAWSMHAYGRAVDLNPVQNPYVRGSTVLPPAGAAHLDRSTPAPGKLLAGDPAVAAFEVRGWSWGGRWSSPRDYQHLERAGAPPRPLPANAGAEAIAAALVERTGTGSVQVRLRAGSGWSAPTDLGGRTDATPAIASWAAGRLDVVALGVDGAFWHRWSSGGPWSAWSSLGGGFLSGPAAASWGPDRLDVFGRGLDGALWTNAWTGASWTGWRSLGGIVTSDPDVASWGVGRLDVFARGADGAIWHRGHGGGQWAPWDSLGGRSGSGPGAASTTLGRIDILTRGVDGQVYGSAWDGSGWVGWYPLGGRVVTDPDVLRLADGSLEVVAGIGDGSALWRRTRSGGTWGGWQPVG